MSTDPFPLGAHPTDDTLLLLSDVTTNDALGELLDGLAEDDAIPFDPFHPEVVTASWTHLSSCSTCAERQAFLLGRVHSALVSVPSSESWLADGADRRLAAAAAALVGTPGAAAESFERRDAPSMSRTSRASRASRQRGRFRWLPGLGRSGGSVSPSAVAGRSSTLVRGLPWAVAAAFIVTGGLVLGFRGSVSEKGAIKAQSADTTSPSSVDGAAEGSAKADTADTANGATEALATETAAAMVEQATPSTEKMTTAGADASISAESNAESNAQAETPAENPPPAAPPSAGGDGGAGGAGGALATDQPSLAAAPPPALPVPTSSTDRAHRAEAASGQATKPVTTLPSQPPPATRAAPAAKRAAAIAGPVPRPTNTGAVSSPIALGNFPDTQGALDAFAKRLAAANGTTSGDITEASAAAPTPPAPAAMATAAPAVTVASSSAVNAQDFAGPVCPNIVGAMRAESVVNGQPVIIVRTVINDPAGPTQTDIVADRATCATLSLRVITP